MKTKRFFIGIIVLALLVSSLTLFDSNGDVPPWRTDKITRGSIAEVVTANGTLNPLQLINVGTQVSGQISQVYVELNDEVKAGQLLAEIDPSLLKAQLRQSHASLETLRTAYEQAQRDLNRTRMLVEKDYVAKVELERAQQSFLAAKNSYESAKSQVERDEVNLNYTKITSPIDGVVIAQEITLGQTMAANFQTPNLYKIAGDLTKMKIDVSLSESDIAKVKKGMPAMFTVDAYPDREFSGKVQMVNLNPNNQAGVVTYTVTVAVENEDKALLPGMTAYVSITLSEVKDVLRVPAAALRFTPPQEQVSGLQRLLQGGGAMRSRRDRDQNKTVSESGGAVKRTIYLLKSGELVPTEVYVGATDETHVEISGDGIAEGHPVVTGIMPATRR
jgi:HlyD family secretion protein